MVNEAWLGVAFAANAMAEEVWFPMLKTKISARLLASEETLFLLSHLRMGVNLGRVKDIDLRTLNELFLLTQPAHLQKIQGKKLEGDLRRAARADYIRQRLNSN